MSTQMLCTTCGTIGSTTRSMKGSIVTEIILWLFFLIPGIIYSIWRHSTVAWVCRNCGSSAVIPLSSPVAQQALRQRGITIAQIQSQARTEDPSLTKVAAWVLGGLLLLGILTTFSNTNHQDHQDSKNNAASVSTHEPTELTDPATWFIKARARRDAIGSIIIDAVTNIPDGVNLWVQLPNGSTSKMRVTGGKISSEPFTNKGRPIESGTHRITFLAYFNQAWEQPAAVLSMTGHDGRKLKGTLFHKTDSDVIDSARFLDYDTTIGFPPISRELEAISLVKSAVLLVDGKRSSAAIGETVNGFLTPSTGIKIGKGWSAISKGSDVYEVQLDIVDAANDGPAIWEADLRTKRVRYINSTAKYMSYLPPD
jgi:hypothetical protein